MFGQSLCKLVDISLIGLFIREMREVESICSVSLELQEPRSHDGTAKVYDIVVLLQGLLGWLVWRREDVTLRTDVEILVDQSTLNALTAIDKHCVEGHVRMKEGAHAV